MLAGQDGRSRWSVTCVGLFRRLMPIAGAVLVVLVASTLSDVPLRQIVFEAATASLPAGTERPATLTVLTRDGSGKKVAAVHLAVFTFEQNVAHRAAEVDSDAAGSTTVHVPEGDTWITASTDAGLARASTHLVLTPGMREVTLTLLPERSVDVDVVDETGAPLAGAELEITGADPLPVGARTDEHGFAHVGRLAGERFVIVGRAGGYEATTNRSVRAGERVRLTLRKLGTLLVEVLDPRGAEAFGAHVRIAGSSLWPPRVTELTTPGGARVSSLPPGSYALEAWNDSFASVTELGVVLARGEEKTVVLHLTPGSFVDVRVTDGTAADAAPVRGARVTVVESGVSPFPREAISDGAGRAHVGPFARGDFRVTAEAEAFAPASVFRAATDGGESRLSLLRGGEISGRVVDTRGAPIAGATLEVIGTDVTGAPIDEDPQRERFRRSSFDATLAGPVPLVAAGELGVMPGPVPPIPHLSGAAMSAPMAGASSMAPSSPLVPPPSAASSGPPREPWVSRGDGTFHVAPIPPGRVRVLARHPQYVEGTSEIVLLEPGAGSRGSSAPEVTLVLSSGGALEGRVVDEGSRPVAGARVSLAASAIATGSGMSGGAFEHSTRTAADGTFAFAAVPDNAILLVSRDPLALSAEVRMPVEVPERGRRDLVVTLPEARAPLHVRVTDDRGFPLGMVQLGAESLDPATPLRTTAFTDSRGEATLIGAHGIALKIEARAPAHATTRLETDGQRDLTVTLGPGLAVAGEVRGSRHGEPIAGADVILYADDGPHRARTDASGRYQLADLPSGKARIEARAPGYAPASRASLVLVSELPRLELEDEAAISGIVVDERGQPVAGARVARGHVPVYLAAAGAPTSVVLTDTAGVFRLGQLPDGDSTLEAYAADVGRGHVDVHLFAGTASSDVRIQLVHERASSESQRAESSAGVAVTLGERTAEREVVIVAVAEGSQAERAGLEPGDLLVAVDGQAVGTLEEARSRLSGPLVDDVLVEIRRDGATLKYPPLPRSDPPLNAGISPSGTSALSPRAPASAWCGRRGSRRSARR